MKCEKKILSAFLVFGISLALIVGAVGCGGDSGTTLNSSQTTSAVQQTEEDTSGYEGKTEEEEMAIEEAISYAEEANPGSSFRVVEIVLVEGWARVDLEEAGAPLDEAVGFVIYLERLDDGSWDYITSGTDVSPEDIPDAPGELFD